MSVRVVNINGATQLSGPAFPAGATTTTTGTATGATDESSRSSEEGNAFTVFAYSSFAASAAALTGGGSEESSSDEAAAAAVAAAALEPTTLTVTGLTVTSGDGDGGLDVVKCRIACTHGKVSINPSNATKRLDFTSFEYCESFLQSLSCLNPHGDGYSETVFLGQPEDVAVALSDLTYVCTTPLVTDTCTVTVYDGAGGECMPLTLLQERRDGSHTQDGSGAASSYASREAVAAAVASGSSNPAEGGTSAGSSSGSSEDWQQCYTSEVAFTVVVQDYAGAGLEAPEASCYATFGVDSLPKVWRAAVSEDKQLCVQLKYLVVGFILLLAVLIGVPLYVQRTCQERLNYLIGLDQYDSDNDSEDEGSARAKLYQNNEPSNWLRIKAPRGGDEGELEGMLNRAGGLSPSETARVKELMVKVTAEKKRKKAEAAAANRGGGGDLDEEAQGEEEGEFFYHNVKTGRSQWERPVFVLGPPVPQDTLANQGIEDDPSNWVSMTIAKGSGDDHGDEDDDDEDEDDAGGGNSSRGGGSSSVNNPLVQRRLAAEKAAKRKTKKAPSVYYYNTVTKKSTWVKPRFSSNWGVDEDTGEAVALGPVADRLGGSGFKPVFGPSSHVKPTAPPPPLMPNGSGSSSDNKTAPGDKLNGQKKKPAGSSSPSSSSSSATNGRRARWDATGQRDPAAVLGGWVVDAKDERVEAFAKGTVQPSSGVECVY
jgi:hypothetical protein